jgi:hypothetical protein
MLLTESPIVPSGAIGFLWRQFDPEITFRTAIIIHFSILIHRASAAQPYAR